MGKLFILINGFLVERTKIGYSEIVNNGKKLLVNAGIGILQTVNFPLVTIDY